MKFWNEIIKFISDLNVLFGALIGTIVSVTGLWWKYRKNKKKDFVFADETLNEANITIIELRRKNLNLIGENHILYRYIVEIALDCEECSKRKIDQLPEKIRRKIHEAMQTE